ncbi:MAG TPA: glycosyltransferase family 39 protein, partial [Jatrophihabitans sp.]
PLRHYAFDYWLPLPSQLIALVLRYRPGLPAALELNVALVVLMCAGAYALARSLSDVPWAPAVSAAAALVQPVVSAYAMQAESAVYLGAFALPAMAAAVYARRRTALWAVAGALAGLAAMSRSEGLLLCLVLGVAALLWREHSRWHVRSGLLLAGYLAVSAPYLLTNLSRFGTPIPPASASFPFISYYEDLFAPRIQRSPAALFDGGLGRFFQIRGHLIDLQLEAAFAAMSPIVSVLVLLLIGSMALRRLDRQPARLGLLSMLRSDRLVPVGFLVVVFLFDALVVPAVAEGGAIVKVMITGVPILLVLAVVQLSRLRLNPALTALCCITLIGYPLTSVAHHSRATIKHNNDIGRAAAALAAPLRAEAGCLGRPVVLMTRQPWEVNQATGVATVALPTGSLAEILEVAQRYGVTDIDNPAVRLDAPTMARALAANGPLVRSAAFGSRKIYRVKAAAGSARC